jgi:hypothetical protein
MSKQLWGNATWYVFHTLAEKLKLEHSDEIQNILFQFKQICFNLPCPSCQKHAIETVQKAKLDNIKTRDDLKQFFYEFHNIVNKRLNKPFFSKEECDNLYKKANTINVVKHFITVMKSNVLSNEKTMMYSYSRHLCIDSFAKYIHQNGDKFNL